MRRYAAMRRHALLKLVRHALALHPNGRFHCGGDGAEFYIPVILVASTAWGIRVDAVSSWLWGALLTQPSLNISAQVGNEDRAAGSCVDKNY